jgi:5'(3')-deoxyribonucleotidase
MISNILCDLDGVLADFASLAIEKLNWYVDEPIAQMTIESYAHVGKFNIAEVYGISMSEFWLRLEKGDKFWCNEKPFPWAKDLLDWLGTIAPVTICTSPSNHPVACKQKTEWVEKHLGLNNNHLMIGSRKYLMGKSENLLIDDYERNVKAFRDAGGKAIQVPSNWNTNPLTFALVKEKIISEL